MKCTTSCPGKCSVPLKAMCSTKCARPRWSSSSSTEPALTTSRSSARALRLPVLADVVAQPVRQRADRDQRIDRNGRPAWRARTFGGIAGCCAPAMADGRHDRREEEGETETLFELHQFISSNLDYSAYRVDFGTSGTAGMPLRPAAASPCQDRCVPSDSRCDRRSS